MIKTRKGKECCKNDIDVDRCLNALTQDMGLYRDYDTHVGCFRKKRQAFFPK